MSSNLFDEVLELEERFEREGYAEGLQRARSAAASDARKLGEQKGAEIAEEVGHCRGTLAVWKAIAAEHPARFSDKALKAMSALEQRVAAFPFDDPQDEGLHTALNQVRSAFKLAKSLLGEKVEISTPVMSF